MENLFVKPEAKEALQSFRIRVEAIQTEGEYEKGRNHCILVVLRSMESTPEQWDLCCQINIGWIGGYFIKSLSDSNEQLDKRKLDLICSDCFRFLFEMDLSIKNDLSRNFERVKRFILTNLDKFEEDARLEIDFALKEMPISIIKSLLNSDSITSIKDFNLNQEKAEKLKVEWGREISEKEKRVNQLKKSLDEYENAFNFVGLYQGFDDLAVEKTKEKDSILYWLRILSVVIILPILSELFVILNNIEDIAAIKDGLLVSLVPTISFVAICTYYFRILLVNYKSVKSQLLQIDLRKTLCRFIQSYSGYSAGWTSQLSLDSF